MSDSKERRSQLSFFPFEWVWFLLCSHWWWFWRGIQQQHPQLPWGLAKDDRVWHPATCGFLCVSGTGPAADRIRTGGVTERGRRLSPESWAHDCVRLTETMVCQNRGRLWTSAPCPMKYWSLFLWIIFSCTCTCFTLSLSLLSFYKRVFFCSPVSSPLDLHSFSSLAVLFWCGLDCTCFVFEVMSHSVSPSWVWAPPPHPVLRSDLMLFVFLFRVYCY